MSGFGSHGSMFAELVQLVRAAYDADERATDVPAPSWQAGRLDSKHKSALPLVHWTRPSGSFEEAEIPGRRDYVATSGIPYWFAARYDDVADVECTIVAGSWAELDCVHGAIIRAARNALHRSVSTPGGYQHLTEVDDDPIAMPGHQVLVQSFSWRYPVVHEWGQLTLPTSVTGTTRQQSPDGLAYTAGPTFTQP